MPLESNPTHLLELTSDVVVAWLSNPKTKVAPEALPAAIQTIHQSLAGLGTQAPDADAEPQYEPAVTVRRSLASDDHIISMIDGKPYKMLKRHLGQNGLTPQQYRERYNLKADYPMTAPAYSAKRAELAKSIGLGRKPAEPAAADVPITKPKRAQRKSSPQATPAPGIPATTVDAAPAEQSTSPARGKLTMFKSDAEG